MDTNGKILFEEVQRFRIKWIWILLLFCVASSIAVFAWVAATSKDEITKWILPVVVCLELFVCYLLYIIRLETVVTTEGVYYRWAPVMRKPSFIPRLDLEQSEIRKGPLMTYGWHWVPGYGWVNNTGPGDGLQFQTKRGKIFIGTHQLAAFKEALEKITTVSLKT